jgi:hypothetical protein
MPPAGAAAAPGAQARRLAAADSRARDGSRTRDRETR